MNKEQFRVSMQTIKDYIDNVIPSSGSIDQTVLDDLEARIKGELNDLSAALMKAIESEEERAVAAEEALQTLIENRATAIQNSINDLNTKVGDVITNEDIDNIINDIDNV